MRCVDLTHGRPPIDPRAIIDTLRCLIDRWGSTQTTLENPALQSLAVISKDSEFWGNILKILIIWKPYLHKFLLYRGPHICICYIYIYLSKWYFEVFGVICGLDGHRTHEAASWNYSPSIMIDKLSDHSTLKCLTSFAISIFVQYLGMQK